MKNKSVTNLVYEKIASIITEKSSVLDLGCGAGDLLYFLANRKKISGQGIEINETAVYSCVEKGLTVFHSDVEQGLNAYPDASFDFVIALNCLQEIKKVDAVMEECFRLSKTLIVGFPNFAHLSSRLSLLKGRSPRTKSLPFSWFDSPNLRFLSVKDFETFCAQRGYVIANSFFFGAKEEIRVFPNLLAHTAVFAIRRD